MDKFTRITPMMDVDRLQNSCVTVVGNGGGANLARNLARCGVGRIKLVDFDKIELINVCRQEHSHDTIGMRKVDALATELRRINPTIEVECYAEDFCSFTEHETDRSFADTDLFVFCVDNLAANARGNEVCLRLRKPGVWSGVYPKGEAGEVYFWYPRPQPLPCYRCVLAARYKTAATRTAGPPPVSADVLAVQFIDSIAGMVCIGQLTRGANNQYGRLLEQLDDRNFLHVKVFPDWTFNGRDVFREQLRIPGDCDTYFGWTTAARRDPDGGEPPCPDCIRFGARVPANLPA